MYKDLWSEIQGKMRELDVCVRELRKSGTAYAEAERDYQIEKADQTLKLKSQGKPVGIITTIIKGVQPVADKLFKRMVAETVYRANLEAINSIKIELRIIEAQYEREWGQAKNM